MLRSRKKDVNIKPNRKLDKRSSRGMLYENEELRLRTIEINAEVERGQCDLKKLRRENQRLRRDIWSLREEYERLESEMAKMRKGVGDMEDETAMVERRKRMYGDEGEREDGDEDDGDEDDDEEFDGEGDEDDEEDEEEENAENLQKVNYYNSGRLEVVEERSGKEEGGIRAEGDEEGEGGRAEGTGGRGCDACGIKGVSQLPEEGCSSGNGVVAFPSGGNLEQLVREVTPNGHKGALRGLEGGGEAGVVASAGAVAGGADAEVQRGAPEERNEEVASASPSKGCRKWLGNKLNFSATPNVSQDSSQASTPSSSTSAIPLALVAGPSCPLHPSPPTPTSTPSPPCTALLEASSTLTPELTMRDVFASLANRLDSIVGVRLLSAPGASSTLALISLKTPQDLESLIRTGLEIRGHLYNLSDAASVHLPTACDPNSASQNLQNGAVVNQRVCKESELGSVKEEDEGTEESGRMNGLGPSGNVASYARLSSSVGGLPRTRSPSPALQKQSLSLSLPATPLPSCAGTASPKFPSRLEVDKQFGHCRSASADASNDPSSKQRACVNFEETCAGGNSGKGPSKKKNGILRRNVSQGEEEGEGGGGGNSCNHHQKPCRMHVQRSFSLDPRGSFHRRKGIGSDRSSRACEDGGSGMEADSEASRRGGSVSSRGSGGGVNSGVGKGKGARKNRSAADASSKDLPWCGCWGNGCF